MQISIVVILLTILWSCNSQVIEADGRSMPLILKMSDLTTHISVKCIDEDPDNGDRVIGGKAGTDVFVGYKDGAAPADYNSPDKWKWMFNDASGEADHSPNYCKFSPNIVTTFNSKLIMMLSGSYTTFFTAPYISLINPRHPGTPSYSFVMSSLKASERVFETRYEICLPFLQLMMEGQTLVAYMTMCSAHGSYFNLYQRILQIIKFDTSSTTVVVSQHAGYTIGYYNPSGMFELAGYPFFVQTSTKLIMSYTSMYNQPAPNVYSSCITQWNLGFDLATMATNYVSQHCDVLEYLQKCEADTSKICENLQIGPIDYFDKIVAFGYWRIGQMLGGMPSYHSDSQMVWVGECEPGNFYRVAFSDQIGPNRMLPRAFKAFNSTSNFVIIDSDRWVRTTSTTGTQNHAKIYMLHVHFDPDPASCASGGYKTPFRATWVQDRYLFPSFTSYIMQDTNGAAFYSQRLQSMVVGGSAKNLMTHSQFSTINSNIGFTFAMKLSWNDNPDQAIAQSVTVTGRYNQVSKPILENYWAITSPAVNTVIQDRSTNVYSLITTNLYDTCYQKAQIKPVSRINPFEVLTVMLGEILPWTDLLEIDPACTLLQDGYFLDLHQNLQDYTLQINNTHLTAHREQPKTFFAILFKIGTSYFFSPNFQIAIIANPCSTPPTFGARALYIPVSIAWVDIDGGAVVAPDSEFTPVTFDFYALGAIQNPTIPPNINCNYQVLLDVIQNAAGTSALTGYDNIFVVSTTGVLTVQNYKGLPTNFIQGRVRVKVTATGMVDQTLKQVGTIYFIGHPCINQTIAVATGATLPSVHVAYNLSISDWDLPYAPDLTTVSPATFEIASVLVSSDPVACPMKEYGFNKVMTSTGGAVANQQWVTVDSATGSVTIDNYSMNLFGTYYVYLKARTDYKVYDAKDTTHVAEVIIDMDPCLIMADLTSTNSTDVTTLITNIWETNSPSSFVIISNQPLPEVTFDLSTSHPIQTPKVECPILFTRIKVTTSAHVEVDPVQWQNLITYDEITQIVKIANYVSADPQIFDNLLLVIQSRHRMSQTSGVLTTIKLQQFECTKTKILNPSSVRAISANYKTFVPLKGDPQPETTVESVELTMTTGFFDTGLPNCTLNDFFLAEVLQKDGSPIASADWKQMIVFDSSFKILKIQNYGGANTTVFDGAQLLFQSKINTTYLSPKFHLVDLTITETKEIEIAPPEPIPEPKPTPNVGPVQAPKTKPEFKTSLQPIFVQLNFSSGIEFKEIKYTMPERVDPQGEQLNEPVITNLAEYPFVRFNQTSGLVTVDPNRITSKQWGSMVTLFVLLSNSKDISQEYKLTIIIENTAFTFQEFQNRGQEAGRNSSMDETTPRNQTNSDLNNTLSGNATSNNTASSDTNKTVSSDTNRTASSDTNMTASQNASLNDQSIDAATNGTLFKDEEKEVVTEKIVEERISALKFKFKARPDFQDVLKQEQQYPAFYYDFENEEWERKPTPPKMRNVQISSKGEVDFSFNQPVVFPPDYKRKFEADQAKKAKAEEGRRLKPTKGKAVSGEGGDESDLVVEEQTDENYDFMRFAVQNAITGEIVYLPAGNVAIEDMTETDLKIKLTFDNPEYISLSGQSAQDTLVIEFSVAKIKGENGFELDESSLGTDENGNPLSNIVIMPMVDEEATEVQALESWSDAVFNVGFLIMIGQFLLTFILATTLSFFWDLVNSQINFIYMPLLSVNAPGQWSFYLEVLIFVCTFDPIPMDIILAVFPIFNFDYTSAENEHEVFFRVGIEDRNFVNVLGSMILIMFIYLIMQGLYQILSPFKKYSHRIRRVLRYIQPEAAYRTVVMLFFLEMYLDLMLGGLINTENDYLLDDPANWGSRGFLSISDQFSIVLGNIIYIGCSIFPFVVIYLMERKFRQRYVNANIRHEFDGFFESLYENLRTNVSGLYHLQSLTMLRKMVFAYIVFFLMAEEYILLQLAMNLLLSLFFCLYIAHVKPYIDPMQNKLQVLNEMSYYLVSLLYICFTDFQDNPEIKVTVGWFVVMVGVCNLIWPNLVMMLQGVWPDIRDSFKKAAKVQISRRQYINLRQLEKQRKRLIKNAEMKLKAEFMEEPEQEQRPQPARNQVVDEKYFKEISGEEDFYEIKKERLQEQKKLKHYVPKDDIWKPEMKPPLEVIDEESQEYVRGNLEDDEY